MIVLFKLKPMENTMEKLIEISGKTKTLIALSDAKSQIMDLIENTNVYSGNEYEYCEKKASIQAFQKAIEIINNQIKLLM